MKLKPGFVIFLLMTLCIAMPSYGQVPEKQVVKEAEKVFDAEITMDRKALAAARSGEENTGSFPDPAPPVQPADEIFVLHDTGGSLLGYCFASSAKGRFENFEYFILYDTAGVVQKVKVWKYRSSHGGAVAGKRWLRQFAGYRKGALTYGRDVQAISGATISGDAMVSEVVRAGKVMEGLVL